MDHQITQTEQKYTENVRFNLEASKEHRNEVRRYITEMETCLREMDGRKKKEIEVMEQRIERAKADEERLKAQVEWLDTMETITEEAAWIDDQISVLLARRNSIIDITRPDPFKTKWHGML